MGEGSLRTWQVWTGDNHGHGGNMPTPYSEGAAEIYRLIPVIMGELGFINKDLRAPGSIGGFQYRGIEQMVAGLQPLFVKHGVFCYPTLINSQTEHTETASKKPQVFRVLTYDYRFCAADGSSITVRVQSEAADTFDKGSNKAATAALKLALGQLFMIHSEQDADSYDVEHRAPVVIPTVHPTGKPRAWWHGKPEAVAVVKEIGDLAERLGPDTVEKARQWLASEAGSLAPSLDTLKAYRDRWQAELDKASQPELPIEGELVAAGTTLDDEIPF